MLCSEFCPLAGSTGSATGTLKGSPCTLFHVHEHKLVNMSGTWIQTKHIQNWYEYVSDLDSKKVSRTIMLKPTGSPPFFKQTCSRGFIRSPKFRESQVDHLEIKNCSNGEFFSHRLTMSSVEWNLKKKFLFIINFFF